MRLNRFIAQASGMSRRAADEAIQAGRVRVGDDRGKVGQVIDESSDLIYLDGQALTLQAYTTIVLNKPVGYVVSRAGQGSKTVYDLLSTELHHLKPVGRLDKDSSGLLLLTNDGQLTAQLTHPSHEKEKMYEVELDRPLNELHRLSIEKGVELEDGPSSLQLEPLQLPHYSLPATHYWQATLAEGRNRQIRRTFEALGYKVTKLHRTHFGPYHLGSLEPGTYRPVKSHQGSA